MDRELLLEIGCEELPASWLPPAVAQLGDRLGQRLAEQRLEIPAPIETFGTPRRLTARIARLAERQTDLEELLLGPAVAAAFGTDGTPTPAALGFARKHGIDAAALERTETPKGTYLAYRKQQRGKATSDVLPHVLAGVLRDLSFPKQMHWDAWLDDGRGELLFGRPIRWLLFLYGGRVVPFTIKRSDLAASGQVQEVRTAAVTYGHRFLATTGRSGRAIKVRSFDEYRARLAEHFVLVDRQERHDKIARELDAHAGRLGGRVGSGGSARSALLHEVPDLVEYPSVVAGTFAPEFLELPEEVLATTMIHHQHFFPVFNADGRLLPAFLAVTNTQADNAKTIARNCERVLTARLRDARFFWDADRKIPLATRVQQLDTVLFHKALGTYREKAERVASLARWIAADAFGRPETADDAEKAGRLAKADLTTDMVRELTELQGTMGGIYAREEGVPEEVWKAIYFHYLPVGVEADAPPSTAQIGKAAVTWAAVSLADKVDTIAGLMFKAREQPTGSRDPHGLRRAGHGVVRILVDLEQLSGIDRRPLLRQLFEQACVYLGVTMPSGETANPFRVFLMERLRHLMQSRSLEYEEIQVVTGQIDRIDDTNPATLVGLAREWKRIVGSDVFRSAAEAHKRVVKILEHEWDPLNQRMSRESQQEVLREEAERVLRGAVDRVSGEIESALESGRLQAAIESMASIQPHISRFFEEVRVVVPDENLKTARLSLLHDFKDAVSRIGDPSFFAPRSA